MEFVVEYRLCHSGPSFKLGKVRVPALDHKEAYNRGLRKIPKGAVILSTFPERRQDNEPPTAA